MQLVLTRTAALAAALAATLSTGLMMPSPAQAAPPTITTFGCPTDNGGGLFYCFVDYSSDSAATVSWSSFHTLKILETNEPGRGNFYGQCEIGQPFTVTVTITNASGTVTLTSQSTTCRSGQILI